MSNEFFYFPKVLDGKIEEYGDKVSNLIVDAHILTWRPGILPNLVASTDRLFIDPATGRMEYQSENPESMKELPYYLDAKGFDQLYGDSSFRLKNFVLPALHFQIDSGATAVIVPYFFNDDFISKPSNTNFSMLNDAIIHKEHGHISNDLYATIYIPFNILTNTLHLDTIINRYTENPMDKLKGYFITVNDYEDRKADVSSLKGLAYLVSRLAENTKEVYLNYSGTFGYVLSIAGLTGYISGLGSSDAFSTKNYDSVDGGPRGRRGWTYITEVLNYLNDDDLVKFGYTCTCDICNNSYPKTDLEHKLHFLKMKLSEVELISGKSKEDKTNLIKRKINQAKHFSSDLRNNKEVDPKTAHLDKWLIVVDYLETLKSSRETDQLLEQILQKLESDA